MTFIVSSSFLKPLNGFQPNLTMLCRWSFTSFLFMCLTKIQNNMSIIFSDGSKFQKSSCPKIQSGLNCYIVEMIISWSSTYLWVVYQLDIQKSFHDATRYSINSCHKGTQFRKKPGQVSDYRL